MEEAARMQAAFDRALESQLPRIYAYLRRLGAERGRGRRPGAGDLPHRLAGRSQSARRRRPEALAVRHCPSLLPQASDPRGPRSKEQIGANLAAAPADDPGSDERLAAHLVREALLHLPDKYLQPLALVYWEELSYEEAAQALSIPVGTLGWRVHKALKLIRKALAEEGAEHEAGSPGPEADRTACPPVED